MVQTVAVSGASGRTGFRVVEELLETGINPRMLMRQSSVLQDQRPDLEQIRLDLFDSAALDAALQGVDALVIATGARVPLSISQVPCALMPGACNVRWRPVAGLVSGG